MLRAGLIPPWVTDPLGELYKAIIGGVASLLDWLFTTLLDYTKMDFSQDWFINAYRTTFFLALSVWVVLLLLVAVQWGMRKISAAEAVSAITYRSVMTIYGISLGPMAGQLIANLMAALSKDLFSLGVTNTTASLRDGIVNSIGATDPAEIAGGVVVGIILAVLLLIAALGIAIVVMIVSIMQYLLGALIPIFAVFNTSAKHRGLARKSLTLMLVLMCTPPLMMFFMGMVFNMLAQASTGLINGSTGPNTGTALYQLILAACAMWASLLLPLTVMKLVQSAFGGEAGSGQGGIGAVGPKVGTETAQQVSAGNSEVLAQGGAPSSGVGMAGGGGAGSGGGAVAGAAGGGEGAAAAGAAGAGAGAGAAEGAAAGSAGGPAGMAAGAAVAVAGDKAVGDAKAKVGQANSGVRQLGMDSGRMANSTLRHGEGEESQE